MDMLLKDHFTLWGSFNKFLRMDDKRLITKDQWKMTLKFLIFSGGDIGTPILLRSLCPFAAVKSCLLLCLSASYRQVRPDGCVACPPR